MKKYDVLNSVPICNVLRLCIEENQPTEIAKELEKSIQTISDQLSVLYSNKFVGRVTNGRRMDYKINVSNVLDTLKIPNQSRFIEDFLDNPNYESFSLNQLVRLFKLDIDRRSMNGTSTGKVY